MKRAALVRLVSIALCTMLGAPSARAADPAPDALEGTGLGSAGLPGRERVVVGLELRRDAGGALQLYLTQAILNVYRMPYPGKLEPTGNRIVAPDFGLTLALQNDRLEGTYPGPNSRASLARVTALPQPTTPPDVSRGRGPRWETRLNGQIFATPAVADGVVYVGSTGGVFDALKASDGERLWAFPAGRPIYGEALVDGDAVYFACDNGYLFKLARATGKEVWRYDLGDARVTRIPGHPAGFDWDWQGPKPALDRATGKSLWTHDTGAHVDTAPVVAGDAIVVGNRGVGLVALDRATGERRWRSTFWGSWVESTPRVVDGVLYVRSSDLRRVSAIDPRDGRVLWRTDVFGWTWGTPLVVGDRIYVGAAGGNPYMIEHVASFDVLDRATGAIIERWPLPEVPGAHQWGIGGSLAQDGETIVATTIEGGVYGFGPRS